MAEEAMNAGHLSLAAAILQTIAKLGNSHTAMPTSGWANSWKSTPSGNLARELVKLVSGVICGRFVGWELALEQLADQIVAAIEETKNEPEPKLLEGPK